MRLKTLGYDKEYNTIIKIEKVSNKYFVQIGDDYNEDSKVYSDIKIVKRVVNQMLDDFEQLEGD